MDNESKLLINEPPLQFLPTLAMTLNTATSSGESRSTNGDRKALLLQQIHYWLYNARKARAAHSEYSKYQEGRWWGAYTTQYFLETFAFWSERTLQRLLDALEVVGVLLVVREMNGNSILKTWYAIDYSALNALLETGGVKLSPGDDKLSPQVMTHCHQGDDTLSPQVASNCHHQQGEKSGGREEVKEIEKEEIITVPVRAGEAGAAPASPRKAHSFDRNADAPVEPIDLGSGSKPAGDDAPDERTFFEKKLCGIDRRKRLNQDMLALFHRHLSPRPNTPDDPSLPTLLQAYENDPLFRRWVDEDRLPFFIEMRAEHPKDWPLIRFLRHLRANYEMFEDWKGKHPEHRAPAEAAPATPPKLPKLDDRTLYPWMYNEDGSLKAEFAGLEGDDAQ